MPIIVLATIVCLHFRLLLGSDCCALLYPIDNSFVKGSGRVFENSLLLRGLGCFYRGVGTTPLLDSP